MAVASWLLTGLTQPSAFFRDESGRHQGMPQTAQLSPSRHPPNTMQPPPRDRSWGDLRPRMTAWKHGYGHAAPYPAAGRIPGAPSGATPKAYSYDHKVPGACHCLISAGRKLSHPVGAAQTDSAGRGAVSYQYSRRSWEREDTMPRVTADTEGSILRRMVRTWRTRLLVPPGVLEVQAVSTASSVSR